MGDDIDPEVKRSSTVFVRPFVPLEGLDVLTPSENWLQPGAPVGIYPGLDSLRSANPRDLKWDDFIAIQITVGTIQSISAVHVSEPFVRYDLIVDFGRDRPPRSTYVWFRSPVTSKYLDMLKGRQVIAVTNLDPDDIIDPGDPTGSIGAAISGGSTGENPTGDVNNLGPAVVMTVNGYTIVEPAKMVENGFRLA